MELDQYWFFPNGCAMVFKQQTWGPLPWFFFSLKNGCQIPIFFGIYGQHGRGTFY